MASAKKVVLKLMQKYKAQIEFLKIEPDDTLDEGYSIIPGIDLRYPHQSLNITEAVVQINDDGALLILKHDKHNLMVMPLVKQ